MKPAQVDAAPSRTKEVEEVPVEDEADGDDEDIWTDEEADDDEDDEDENVSLSIQSEYLYSLSTHIARTFTRAQRFSIWCGCHQFETKGIYLRLPQRNQSTQDLERTSQSSRL